MSHVEQIQWTCNRCCKPTLHTRTVIEFNHVLHLLLSVLCCGCPWLPIWFLLAVTHNRTPYPWLCSACGQEAGRLTPEQEYAAHVQRANDAEVAAHFAAIRKSENAAWRAEQMEAAKAGMATAGAVMFAEAKLLPARTDAALKYLAGEGNDILLWFFRIVLGLVVIAIPLFLLWTIASWLF